MTREDLSRLHRLKRQKKEIEEQVRELEAKLGLHSVQYSETRQSKRTSMRN